MTTHYLARPVARCGSETGRYSVRPGEVTCPKCCQDDRDRGVIEVVTCGGRQAQDVHYMNWPAGECGATGGKMVPWGSSNVDCPECLRGNA